MYSLSEVCVDDDVVVDCSSVFSLEVTVVFKAAGGFVNGLGDSTFILGLSDEFFISVVLFVSLSVLALS